MAIIKCKICGGDLNIAEGTTVAECEYCGTMQTIPTADSEKKLTLFGRANRLRFVCDFDKAASVYENIVAEFPEEPEAYWGLVLCRYGIEYVDDPATGKKVPTCHRSSFNSILEDTDFEQACENADAIARRLYREEAKTIEELRKGILEVSGKEKSYDVFICYKETDENGNRTIDSVIAQDVYDALTRKGYRVFFSRISLEDKLGTEYEPYIFAALNSAKIMLVFGTDYEYFNAVWVKNEWSRFLSLIAAGQKKTLIPCFKGIDAYDMPKEFARLQAQDMGKLGAIQDLLRGIDKIMDNGIAERPQETDMVQGVSGGANMEVLLKRGNMALEDRKWDDAKGFFNRALDIDPELAWAYLGLAMAQAKCRTEEEFRERYTSTAWKGDSDTARAKQFASPELQKRFECWDEEKTEIAASEAAVREESEKEKRRQAEIAAREAEERAKREAEIAAKEAKERARREAEVAARRAEMAAREAKERAKRETEIAAKKAAEEAKKGALMTEFRKRSALAAKQICVSDVVVDNGSILGFKTFYIAGLNTDGRVVVRGHVDDGQRKASKWTDILAVDAGDRYTVGLKSDGRVLAVGNNDFGQCNVKNWSNIVAIAAGPFHTVGLKADGTVVAAGRNDHGQCNVSKWTDIIAIAAGNWHTVGLKTDGTVISVGENGYGLCDVREWTDIVAIAAGCWLTVGLKADGTVVAVGNSEYGKCDVNWWTDIVAIAAGSNHTVGLKADGTVVAVGYDLYSQCDVGFWTDIVAIAAGGNITVGLRSDNTVVHTLSHGLISEWKLLNNIEDWPFFLVSEQRKAELVEKRHWEEKIQRNKHRTTLEKERSSLQTELNGLKGMFAGRRRREIESRLAQIETELKKL